jgi:hypothetical protein
LVSPPKYTKESTNIEERKLDAGQENPDALREIQKTGASAPILGLLF